VTLLIKKIEQQDDTIAKLRAEESKLGTYIREFKEAIDKKLTK
jgi:hypothetical protein